MAGAHSRDRAEPDAGQDRSDGRLWLEDRLLARERSSRLRGRRRGVPQDRSPSRENDSVPGKGISATDVAIAEGRHSETWQTLCTGCYQWVDAIFHSTIDRKQLCLACSIAAGFHQPIDTQSQMNTEAKL
jgi:hypothetical protein